MTVWNYLQWPHYVQPYLIILEKNETTLHRWLRHPSSFTINKHVTCSRDQPLPASTSEITNTRYNIRHNSPLIHRWDVAENNHYQSHLYVGVPMHTCKNFGQWAWKMFTTLVSQTPYKFFVLFMFNIEWIPPDHVFKLNKMLWSNFSRIQLSQQVTRRTSFKQIWWN